MRIYQFLFFLLPGVLIFAGCGGDDETPGDMDGDADELKIGDIYGTVTDLESNNPIEGASVRVGEATVLADEEGKYLIQNIPFSDGIEVKVTAENYGEHTETISLNQSITVLEIELVPIESPIAKILAVLDALSRDVEALDPEKIPALESYLSEDYKAADDPVKDLATFVGINAGVVPPDHDGISDSVMTIMEKYDKLIMSFEDSEVDLDEDTATVMTRFEAYAETKPKADPPEPAKKWEIIVNSQIDFRKEDDDWKIVYWRLIPDFIKFEEEPLEQ